MVWSRMSTGLGPWRRRPEQWALMGAEVMDWAERRPGCDGVPWRMAGGETLAAVADQDVMGGLARMVAAASEQGGARCEVMQSCHHDNFEIFEFS